MKISVQMNNLRDEFEGGKCPLITSNQFHNNTIYPCYRRASFLAYK